MLIQYGDIVAVLKTEEETIKELFGRKYQTALTEMWAYFNSLQPKLTSSVLSFTNPNIQEGWPVNFGVSLYFFL